tara:strand:+ start:329 stop:1225 length:897 start_codon:yes stop_codon:yes gene_type:complete
VLGFGEKTATGIHLSGQRAWLVSMSRRRSVIEPLALVEFDLPVCANALDLAKSDVQAQLVDVLREVGEEYEVDFSNTCFALDPNVVLVKRSKLISGSESEMREHMQWEAEQFLVDEKAAFSIDYVLESNWGLFVAVRRSALSGYLALGKQIGVRRVDVDVPAFALYNAVDVAGVFSRVAGSEVFVYGADSEAYMLLVDQGEVVQVAHCQWSEDDSVMDVLFGSVDRLASEVSGHVEFVRCAGGGVEKWGVELADHLQCEMALIDPLAEIAGKMASEWDPARRSDYAVATGLVQRGLVS